MQPRKSGGAAGVLRCAAAMASLWVGARWAECDGGAAPAVACQAGGRRWHRSGWCALGRVRRRCRASGGVPGQGTAMASLWLVRVGQSATAVPRQRWRARTGDGDGIALGWCALGRVRQRWRARAAGRRWHRSGLVRVGQSSTAVPRQRWRTERGLGRVRHLTTPGRAPVPRRGAIPPTGHGGETPTQSATRAARQPVRNRFNRRRASGALSRVSGSKPSERRDDARCAPPWPIRCR